MGRPARPLVEHLRQGTFRARRHHRLLGGHDVPWPAFALMQARYRAATSEPERRAVALECEQALGLVHSSAAEQAGGTGGPSLDQELLSLGKPRTIKQLLAFFPHFLRHAKGALLGQPFELEAWQKRFLREFYRRDKKGRRIYSRAVLGVPRGNGKTPLAAGLGLYGPSRVPRRLFWLVSSFQLIGWSSEPIVWRGVVGTRREAGRRGRRAGGRC